MALWFLVKSREDYDGALKDYLTLVRTGGQKSFPELLADAGVPSPFEEGSLKKLAGEVLKIAETLK